MSARERIFRSALNDVRYTYGRPLTVQEYLNQQIRIPELRAAHPDKTRAEIERMALS